MSCVHGNLLPFIYVCYNTLVYINKITQLSFTDVGHAAKKQGMNMYN